MQPRPIESRGEVTPVVVGQQRTRAFVRARRHDRVPAADQCITRRDDARETSRRARFNQDDEWCCSRHRVDQLCLLRRTQFTQHVASASNIGGHR